MTRFTGHRRLIIVIGILLLGTISFLTQCGGSASTGSSTKPTGTGVVTTSLTDPATCAAPNGPYAHVWVTITKVTANLSGSAGPNGTGWVTLLDLTNSPRQIDLLSLASTTCLLTQLGSTTGLPPGDYQQIRIYLLANSPPSGAATPPSNQCAGGAMNCVVLSTSVTQPLQLSSEAQTGIKIPSGQIAGGGIQLAAGQAADINVNFDTCDSIVQEGNGQFRLKPTLHAGEASANNNAISGAVVDSTTQKPIAGALVFLEQPDSNSIDRVIEGTRSAADGTFIVCPLPAGNYDVVVDAETTTGVAVTTTYNATVTFKVPIGTAMGNIPLAPEPATVRSATTTSSPATIQGQITTTSSGGPSTSADVSLSALQSAVAPGSSTPTLVTVPILASTPTPPNIATASKPSVQFAGSLSSCPGGTDCENYQLIVPASNAEVGLFSASPPTSYTAPPGAPVIYWVNAQAFIPLSGGEPDCTVSSQPTVFTAANQLNVNPARATTLNFAFTGCAAGF